jgi:hypothetical protein
VDGQKDRPTIVDARNVAAPRAVHVSAKRQASLREVGERSDQPERDRGIQAAGGLVQDEHARFSEQLDGDRDAFALAAGDAAPGKGERAADGRVARATQTERLDDGVSRLGFRARRGARAREGGEKRESLFRRLRRLRRLAFGVWRSAFGGVVVVGQTQRRGVPHCLRDGQGREQAVVLRHEPDAPRKRLVGTKRRPSVG